MDTASVQVEFNEAMRERLERSPELFAAVFKRALEIALQRERRPTRRQRIADRIEEAGEIAVTSFYRLARLVRGR